MEVTILPKGGSVSIKEKAPNVKKVRVGAGWDISGDDSSYDLDLTAVLLNSANKVVDANGVVYYDNLNYTGVHHTGDNLTGEGEGDDEQIEVDLEALPASVEKVAFLVNIYDAKSKSQHFGQVNNSFVRVVDTDGDKELARHDLNKEYADKTGVLVATLVRNGGDWKFEATAEGVDGSIKEILTAKAFA